MAGDGILSIGATVDKTGVDAGLGSIQDGVKATVQSIAVQVEETCAKTKAAWNKLSDEVKAGAATVSAESLKLAEATKRQTAAYADLNRARVISKDANLSEAESTRILASAQTELSSATAEVAAAKQAEAEAVEAANLREGLSENLLVAQFQLAGREIAANFASMKERMVLGAQEGSFEIRDLATAFTGIGQAIAAIVAAGIVVHFADDLAKSQIELGHLAVESGIAVTSLAGLQQIVKESGVDWEAVSMGVVRMTKNLAASGDQFKEMKMAVAGVGLSLKDLQGLSPEQQLQKIAIAFANTANEGNVANAAIEIFGRGGKVLIPILKEQGAQLVANMQATGKLTNVTQGSVDAAAKWQQVTSRLGMEFRSVMVPAIEIVEKAIAAVLAVVKAVDAAIWTVIDALGALAKTAASAGQVVYDAMTGHWTEMKSDASSLTNELGSIWGNYWDKMTKRWKETAALLTWSPKGAAAGEAGVAGEPDADGGAGAPGGGGAGSSTGAGSGALQAGYDPRVSNMSRIQGGAEAVQRQQEDLADAATAAAQQTGNAWGQAAIPLQAFAVQLPKVTLAAQTVTQQASQFTKIWEASFQRLAQGFNQTVSRWIIEGGHFRQMMQQTINQVATHFLQQTMQMTEQWARHELLKVGQHQVAQAQITATDAAGAAQGVAIQKGADTQTNLAAAKTAAKNTYKVVSGWPVVGPILAPIMAAGAFAAVEAFEQGGIVGGGRGMAVPVLAHAGERVLSAQQTTNFEKLVNQSSTSSTSITNHFHDNSNYSAIDGASVSSMVRSHGREWRREAMRQMRLSNAI